MHRVRRPLLRSQPRSRDVPDLLAWLEGGPAPRTIADSSFQAARLDTLRSRLSAAYKGFHALLMRSGCRDFITGKGVETMTVPSPFSTLGSSSMPNQMMISGR